VPAIRSASVVAEARCGTPDVAEDPSLHDEPERFVAWQRSRVAARTTGETKERPDEVKERPDDVKERPDEELDLTEALEALFSAGIVGKLVPTTKQVLLGSVTKLYLGDDGTEALEAEAPLWYVPSTSKQEMLGVYLTGWAKYVHPDSANWASKVIDRRTRAQLPDGTLTGPFDWLEDAASWVGGGVSQVKDGVAAWYEWMYGPVFGDDLPESFYDPYYADLSSPIPGLFWTEDYLNGALVMAVQTVYAFAPLLQLMAPEAAAVGAYRGGAMLREQIAGLPNAATGVKSPRATITDAPVVYPDLGGITVGPGGEVKLSSTAATYAYAIANSVRILPPFRHRAALADYLFWWAHRLHSLAVEQNDPKYKDLGLLAAKCALTEIVELASWIAHEMGHLEGDHAAWHCTAGNACQQYIAQYTFAAATRALLGLPQPHPSGFDRKLVPNAVYDPEAGEWADEYESGPFTPDNCPGTSFLAVHRDPRLLGAYRTPHNVDVDVTVSVPCGGTGLPYPFGASASQLEALL
jgi:hypothetical protein